MAAGALVTDVLVVGGGIVGTSVAAAVAERGASVVLLEPGGRSEGSSLANAGHLVPSHVIPFAAPGMVAAGLRSLLARDDAFAVHPRVGPQVGRWLWRFARSANARNVERGAPVLAALLDRSLQVVQELAGEGADLDLDTNGLLQVFTTQRSWTAGRHEAAEMRRLGYPARELTADQVVEREPTIRGAVGGVLLERDGRLDPALLVAALRHRALARGANLVADAAVGLSVRASGGVEVSTASGRLHAEQVVVAAGVWTPELVRVAGSVLPIVPAKGYSVTVPALERPPRGPLLLMDQRLAVTPLGQGLRISGRYELTRPGDRSLPQRRAEALVLRARPVLQLPLDAQAGQPWYGLRPATPDGLPVIGRLEPDSPIVVASGHGMLGTSMGPGTGRLVADILSGRPLSIDLAPLAPHRFRRPRRIR
jgi:D-amino-acid dehydrogenase